MNPPALFLGRDEEQRRLRDTLSQAPVAGVFGLGGLGKTSLALKTLHAHFPEQVPLTLMLKHAPGEDLALELLDLIPVLAQLRGVKRVDRKSVAADTSTLLETLLDLGEAGRWWVLIDNIDEQSEVARELATVMTQYARNSRWLFTGRVNPSADLADAQMLLLAPLADSTLRQLASTYAPGLSAAKAQKLVAAAHGSPWRLKQLLSGHRMNEDDLLAPLSETARAFVMVLLTSQQPLSLAAVETVTPLPLPEELDALERLGVIERTADGFSVHGSARPLLPLRDGATQALQPWRVRLVDALIDSDDPAAALEVLSQLAATGAFERLAEMGARRFERLLQDGQLGRLWRIIGPLTHPALSSLRLRCAVEWGRVEALAAVGPPPGDDRQAHCLWARALHLLGRHDEAITRCKHINAQAETPLFEAELLHAICACTLGRPAEALEILSRLSAATEASTRDKLRVAAYRMRCLADLGSFEEAIALGKTLVAAVTSVDLTTRLEICAQLAPYMVTMRQIDLAAQLFALVPVDVEDEEITGHASTMFLIARLAATLANGQMQEAAALLRKLGPAGVRQPALQPIISVLEQSRRVIVGDFAGSEEALQAIARACAETSDAFTYPLVMSVLEEIWILRAKPAEASVAHGELIDARMPAGFRLAFSRSLHALRANGAVEALAPAEAPRDLAFCGDTLLATKALLAGDQASAITHAQRAVGLAATAGDVFVLLSRLLLGDCLLLAGKLAEARAVAEHVAEMAARFPSPRYVAAATLLRVLAVENPRANMAWAQLEALSALADVAPDVCRRARALLGASVPLDQVDVRVVRRVQEQMAPVATRGGPDPWRSGWGLDASNRELWLPDGTVVSLATMPLLFRLMRCLAEHPRGIDKHAMISEVWETERFHPTAYSNRLHVGISKLRQLIERDPLRPKRVVTTEAGYDLGSDDAFRYVPA